MRPKRYKAKDLLGNWVEGWYVEHHRAVSDNHDKVVGYETVPSLFNDAPGTRGKGSYWHTIDPDTLEEMPQQATIFF